MGNGIFDFNVDETKCIRCGRCVEECVYGVLQADPDGKIFIAEENRDRCIQCQHCMTVCPAAAFQMNGLNPSDAEEANTFDPEVLYPALKSLVHSRRSIRNYCQKNVDRALLSDLLEQLKYVPTGVNYRHLAFTVVDDLAVMDPFRENVYRKLAERCREEPENSKLRNFAPCVDAYYTRGKDMIFRTAPHLILAGTRNEAPCKETDPLIALSYFELLANARGIGTVWCGRLMWLLDAMPELKNCLALPDDAEIRYAMLFGIPLWQHCRTAQVDEPEIRSVRRDDIIF